MQKKITYKTKALARRAQTIQNHASGHKLHVYKGKNGYHLSRFRYQITFDEKNKRHIYGCKQDAEIAAEEQREKGTINVEVYKSKLGWHWSGHKKP